MFILLKNDEFHKIAIKSYSMCFLIKDNEIDKVFFLYIILSYMIIRYFEHSDRLEEIWLTTS